MDGYAPMYFWPLGYKLMYLAGLAAAAFLGFQCGRKRKPRDGNG